MSAPAGYYWKNGWWWGPGGSGPYSWNGSAMVLLSIFNQTVPLTTPVAYIGNVQHTIAGAGPVTRS